MWICIMPCHEHTSKVLCYGTCSQGNSQFYLHTPRSFANGMNHTCLCLPSRSWYSFTDPWEIEGWVGLNPSKTQCMWRATSCKVSNTPGNPGNLQNILEIFWLSLCVCCFWLTILEFQNVSIETSGFIFSCNCNC